MPIDLLDDDREEAVEQFDDLHRWSAADHSGGADHIDEQHGHMAFLAAERGLMQLGCRGHLAPDVAAEQVANLLPLA